MYAKRLKLNSLEDLEEMREKAQDRHGWRDLVDRIVRASQASTPVGVEANGN